LSELSKKSKLVELSESSEVAELKALEKSRLVEFGNLSELQKEVELVNLVGTVGAVPDDIHFLLQTDQMRDEAISKIRDELAEGPVKSIVLIDGVVYHEDTNQNRTLYVPSSIRDD